MDVIITALIVLGILAYLAIGFFIARYFSFNSVDTMPWWQIVLVIFLWPLVPIFFLIAFVGWMNRGSH